MAEDNKKLKVVAIIPARGGSKGIPRKNVKFLAGKPLITYTIEAAKNCRLIDRVIVSTDDDEIAEVSKKYGAEVPFKRPEDLAQDLTPTEPVLKHAVEWLQEKENYKTDIVVFLQTTDIFRTKDLLDKVVGKLIENNNLDSVFTVTKTHKNFWRNKDGKFIKLAEDISYGPRQKRELLYREDTGLGCATRSEFIKEGRRIGNKVDFVVNESEIDYLDIHHETDFWVAEKIIQEYGIIPNQ